MFRRDMKTPSITLALVASLIAALVVAGKAMPPTPVLPPEAVAPVAPAQAEDGSTQRSGEGMQ